MTLLAADPTPERDWNSKAGTTIKAVAQTVEKKTVSLVTTDGRTLKVPLDKLTNEDQAFLIEHFSIAMPKPGEAFGSDLAPASGLPQDLGESAAPIVASSTSKYLIYLPTTLKEGRSAPLLFWTHSGGGSPKILNHMKRGAEFNGWIVACSMESRNNNGFEQNHENTKDCLKHIKENFPIDPDRIYFTGSSGGAATAFYNAVHLPHAGVLSSVGYLNGGTPSGGDYFISGGAYDFNRYISARAGKMVGERKSTLRYHPKGHGVVPDWLINDGMLWLNLRYLEGKEKKMTAECQDFEFQTLAWLNERRAEHPHRAYHAALQITQALEISDHNAPFFEKMMSELGTELNKRYVEGLEEMEDFGRSKLEPYGDSSQMKHTTPQLEAAAQKLSTKYAGVPEIEELALLLGRITDKLGK